MDSTELAKLSDWADDGWCAHCPCLPAGRDEGAEGAEGGQGLAAWLVFTPLRPARGLCPLALSRRAAVLAAVCVALWLSACLGPTVRTALQYGV